MKVLFKILLIIFLVLVGITIYPVLSYLLWQKQFNAQIPQFDCSSNLSELVNLDDKFKNFVFSEEKTEFVELSIEDVLSLLKGSNIINGGELTNICIVPNSNVWDIYAHVSIQGITLPWVRVEIAKDAMETAQLYVKNIYIGNIFISEKFSQNIKEQMNKGISDGIILVNENSFLGRRVQNIELLKDKIVIKGTI